MCPVIDPQPKEASQCGQADACPYSGWMTLIINREQRETLKEKRREELFHKVKGDVLTWAILGTAGYVLLLMADGAGAHIKAWLGKT